MEQNQPNQPTKQIPIWFFIGVVLTVYGFLIFVSGIYGAINPPPEDARVALWNLHADIWWGAFLFVIGLVYSFKFPPRQGAGGIDSLE